MKDYGYCFATAMLLEKKLPVRFMYREKGKGSDSGWRFFSGLEDQSYTDNPDNIRLVDVKTVFGIDKNILPYLDCKSGSAFEWSAEQKSFKKVDDFEFIPEEG